MKPFFLLPMLAAALALNACATPDGEKNSNDPIAQFAEDPRLGDPVKRVCFSRNIDGFGQTTRRTVVLTRGVREDYLVTVMGGCFKLDHAQSIGIDNRGSSCISRGDALIVSESAFSLNDSGIGPDRCIINSIYKWDKKAADKAVDSDGDPQGETESDTGMGG